MPYSEADKELYRELFQSSIAFVKKAWKLVPQPPKPEYAETVKELVANNQYTELKAKYFGTWDEDAGEYEWYEFQKGKHITWQQWQLLLAVDAAVRGEAKRRISVESGHGTGKSTTLSWLILWFLFTRKDAQIPCTAPTSSQLQDILWKEASLWLNRMPDWMKDMYEWSAEYIRIKEHRDTWFARARTGRKENPEALAGVHGDHILYIADEASGIDDTVFATAEGAFTNQNFLFVMISNHTRIDGYYHESFNKDKANWQNLSFNGIRSPIVDKVYVERIKNKDGEESDEYRIRVLGKSPKVGMVDNKGFVQLINENQVWFAEDSDFMGEVKLGVDPAGEGNDRTEWVARDEFKAKAIANEKTSKPAGVAEKTATLMTELNVSADSVWVDNFGEGADVGKHLAWSGEMVNTVNVGDEPLDPETFLNMRAEAYWALRQWLISGGQLVGDKKTWAQLFTVKYKRGLKRLQIMSKQEMRKEGIKSPDRVDALMLTFCPVNEDNGDAAVNNSHNDDNVNDAI
jgi:phage terminase large subunit